MKTFIYIARTIKENSLKALEIIDREVTNGSDITISTCTTAEKYLSIALANRGIDHTSITPEIEITRIFGSPDKTPCLELDNCPRVVKEAYIKNLKTGILESQNVIFITAYSNYIDGLIYFAIARNKNVTIINYRNPEHSDAVLFTYEEIQLNTRPASYR